MLTLLPDCLGNTILRDWLSNKEIRSLDWAYCVREGHELFLSLLNQLVLSKAGIGISDELDFAWMLHRKVLCSQIFVKYVSHKQKNLRFESLVIQLIEQCATKAHTISVVGEPFNNRIASVVSRCCCALREFHSDGLELPDVFQLLEHNSHTLQIFSARIIKVEPIAQFLLMNFPSMECLTTLSWTIHSTCDATFFGEMIAKTKRLQKLRLNIGGGAEFEFSPMYSQLRSLHLKQSWPSETMYYSVLIASMVVQCPHIANLDLEGLCYHLTDEDVLTVAQHLQQLRTLNIHNCKSITDRSLQHLTEHSASTLQLLYLGGNAAMTRTKMDYLIEKCRLLNNNLTLRCVQEFYYPNRNGFYNPVLTIDEETTVISTCSVDDEYVKECVVHTHAEILQVCKCEFQLSEVGLAELCVKLPRLRTIVVEQHDECYVRKLARDSPQLSVTTDKSVYEYDFMSMPV